MELTLDQAMEMALSSHKAGRLDRAAALYAQILNFEAKHPEAAHLLGIVFLQQGKTEEAASFVTRAIALEPQNARFLNTMGEIHRFRRDAVLAESFYIKATEATPIIWEPWSNLALLLLERGDAAAAVRAGRRAVEIEPSAKQAQDNLRAALIRSGDRQLVIQELREATERNPEDARSWRNLGFLLAAESRPDLALEAHRRAVGASPHDAENLEALSTISAEHGFVEEARAALEQAYRARPHDGLRLRLAMLLPVILPGADAVPILRKAYRDAVSALDGHIQLKDPIAEVGATNFLLAYHGEDDRSLQELVAGVYLQACPSLSFRAPHCAKPRRPNGRIRIGFLSRFLHTHSIGKSSRGLIANLPRDRFHVTTIHVEPPPPGDTMAKWIDEHSDDVVTLPHRLETARERLAGEELDILFYQDIGMDPFTYYLSFSRLAPVQCVSFGHPETSGVPSMDYFLSTDEFEPDGGDAHYSERLVRLPTQISHYYRPPLAEPMKRADLGLDQKETLYLCPQTLFKIHPAFDPVLRRILLGDPGGRLLLLASPFFGWGERLAARFRRTMPDVVQRITFLPPLRESAFRSVTAMADVILDTPSFGGYNTSLEAFAAGSPVITRPGRFQRSRHTAAFYRRMGIQELTVETDDDYVARALELGADPMARRRLGAVIRERSGILFEDPAVAPCYAEWFEAAARDRLS